MAAVANSATEGIDYLRRLERLLEASRLLNSTLELTELTKIVFRIVRDEVPVDRSQILLVVDQKQKLLRSFFAEGVEKVEISLPIGQGIAGTVAATGQALDVVSAYTDQRFNSEFDTGLGYRTKDVLCLPVFNRERVLIGVLELLNRTRPLSPRDKDFLSSMCVYLGLALHNAWIHRELLETGKIEEELKHVRERLAHSEKLSTLSELVAGIVHEMRNPLSVALGQCTLLREDKETNTSSEARITKIETAIERALKVAKNFLSFARGIQGERTPTDLNSIISQTVELLAYEFRVSEVAIKLDLAGIPLIKVESSGIQQALVNLLKNARQAAAEKKWGGTVALRSSFDRLKNTIRIEVTDDGAGIPADIQSRIGTLFTTKARGTGTGLGLAVSKRIIEQHEGTLSFRSMPKHGTTFVIELPLGNG